MVNSERRAQERTLILPLAFFAVRLPIQGLLHHEQIFLVRDALRDVFTQAPQELLQRPTILDQPLRARTIVTRVRAGSIELDVLFQAVVSVPWSQIVESAEYGLESGLHYLKEIGSAAAGLGVLKGAAKWLRQRLSQEEIPLEQQDVSIEHKSNVEVHDAKEISREQRRKLRGRLLYEDRPVSVGTVLLNHDLAYELLRPTTDTETERRIGGANLLRDLNLFANGISDLEELRKGDVIFYNNFAALGLRRDPNPDTLYASVAAEDGELRLRKITLTTHEGPETKSRLQGRRIDADSLEDV